jgi:FkbM family methyltransferase
LTSRFRKAFGLLKRPRFAEAAFVHHVAAAVEHLSAIRICAANSLVDAGANKGQFSLAFRSLRPSALIVAFEPLPGAADAFERMFARDKLTSLQRFALAGAEGSANFHVTDREDSSSLLKPGNGQERAFGVRAVSTINVRLKRLDECVDIGSLPHPILLKVDVQGGELGVFEGCDQLREIDFIYVELSFVELYEGQPLFDDVSAYLVGRGFRLAGVFNQVATKEFGPTQVDVLFRRSTNRAC